MEGSGWTGMVSPGPAAGSGATAEPRCTVRSTVTLLAEVANEEADAACEKQRRDFHRRSVAESLGETAGGEILSGWLLSFDVRFFSPFPDVFP